VLDTETGVVKTYYTNNDGNDFASGGNPYQLIYTTQTFN